MVSSHPIPDGRDRRPRASERVLKTTFNVVAITALLAAPITAVMLWLLLTDPLLAGEAVDRGSLLPVMRALVFTVGKAIAAVLAYL